MDFMRKSRGLLFLLMLTFGFVVTAYASDYSVIKVGLESVYNNEKSIQLSSDGALTIGYYDENGFQTIGTLTTNAISIQKAEAQYEDIGGLYPSFEEASAAAGTLGGVPVYLDEGLFAVYKAAQSGTPVPSGERYEVKDISGKTVLLFNQAVRQITFRGYDVDTGMYLTKVGSTKKYRGAIGIGGTTGITPYNILEMEQYLYGVVPGEMSASWPQEALKAQAVAARSIAIYQYNRFASRGYNVVDTTTTQVYGGYLKEDPRTNAAVDATQGETIQYNGKVAEALYFSTSGGATESAVNVWGNAIPYLTGVEDTYETEPAQAPWTRAITLDEVSSCLANQGVHIGTVQGVQIVSRTNSGRVQELKILGTSSSYSLTLEKIRTFFSGTSGGSLKSRLFSFSSQNASGNGSNHASGSQTSERKVTVLSAYGTSDVFTSALAITDGNNMRAASGTLALHSALGTTSVNADKQQSSAPEMADGEIAWGNFTIYGQGFGHGVGMSQSGAKGMAQAGFDYISILTHYYQGVTVG